MMATFASKWAEWVNDVFLSYNYTLDQDQYELKGFILLHKKYTLKMEKFKS